MDSPDYEKLAKNAFGDFSGTLDFDRSGRKNHGCEYGMEKRLILASMVAEDGKTKVLDLASGRGMMTFALQKYGLDVVSTEIEGDLCKNELGKVNPASVVRCDAFRPPFKENGFDAMVSYNFLGEGYMLGELAKGRSLRDVFEGLSRAADTLYSVELQANYSSWFAPLKELPKNGFEPGELKAKFENALGEAWEVKCLGPLESPPTRGQDNESPFGIWMPDKDETGKSGIYDRVGFRFTKK